MNTDYHVSHFREVARTLEKLPILPISRATNLIKKARDFGQRVWIVGNGGSAATAMHFANDLQKMCGLDVVCLPSMISTILAYGNDNGWENMFSNAMGAFQIGDILVAISCSGASPNVVNAAVKALELDGKLIVLTGPLEDRNSVENVLGKMHGIIISVGHDDIKVQEDVHLAICHSIAGAIKDEVRGL